MNKLILILSLALIFSGCESESSKNSTSSNIKNMAVEARQVVAQNGGKYVLKVDKTSSISYQYKNGSFQTNSTPPQEVLPITVTDNKTWGVNIPGIYAGKTVYLSRNGGKFMTINLSGIQAGDTKIIK